MPKRRSAARYRIRRCDGNKSSWMVVSLRGDGSELDSYGSYCCAHSIDSLLKDPHAQHLLPCGESLEIIL